MPYRVPPLQGGLTGRVRSPRALPWAGGLPPRWAGHMARKRSIQSIGPGQNSRGNGSARDPARPKRPSREGTRSPGPGVSRRIAPFQGGVGSGHSRRRSGLSNFRPVGVAPQRAKGANRSSGIGAIRFLTARPSVDKSRTGLQRNATSRRVQRTVSDSGQPTGNGARRGCFHPSTRSNAPGTRPPKPAPPRKGTTRERASHGPDVPAPDSAPPRVWSMSGGLPAQGVALRWWIPAPVGRTHDAQKARPSSHLGRFSFVRGSGTG